MRSSAEKRSRYLLRERLESIQARQHASGEILNDPLSIVLRYDSPQDREVVALIATSFAYGNVKQIIKTLENILPLLGPSPADKIKSADGKYWKKAIPETFKHRFNTADDLGLLLTWLGEALRKTESLERFFIDDQNSNEPLARLLENFIIRFTSLPPGPYKIPKSKGALFFFPKPSAGSGCKRLLLFLRWMVGSGPMALGQWTCVDKSQLIIPVDTHILRISQNLGFTKRKNTSWQTAEEITKKLQLISPDDPTQYDFALCHMGISQACPSRFKITICHDCEMNSFCFRYSKS